MQQSSELKTYTYKMVVLGHYSVGKSSIVLNFVKGEFNPSEESTIGASFLTKTIFIGDDAIKYDIWDTAGQERYYSLIPMYYRGAQVALIVYDVTSRESFERAKNWIEELKYDKPQEFLKVLLANKVDLQEEAVVTIEEGSEYAKKENIMFYETSAKTGKNIAKLFKEVAEALPKDAKRVTPGINIKTRKSGFFCC
jgi:Ras-related protein Rab-5C